MADDDGISISTQGFVEGIGVKTELGELVALVGWDLGWGIATLCWSDDVIAACGQFGHQVTPGVRAIWKAVQQQGQGPIARPVLEVGELHVVGRNALIVHASNLTVDIARVRVVPETGSEPRSDNVVDSAHYRSVLGHFATGITIVTAMASHGPVGFTCQSFSSLSLDPPLIWIAPAASSSTWPHISSVGAFTVNVLGAEQEPLARVFATSGVDKFAGVGYDLGVTGAPRLHGTIAHIDCVLESCIEAGDHFSVVGAVRGLASENESPLVFFRGGFGAIAH